MTLNNKSHYHDEKYFNIERRNHEKFEGTCTKLFFDLIVCKKMSFKQNIEYGFQTLK